MNCPECRSTRLYRSKTRSMDEKVLHTVFPIHYYRCHQCNWRSFRFDARKVSISLVVVIGILFGFLFFELASPIVRAILHLVLS